MNRSIEFYKQHVMSCLLPFWERAMDLQRGGVYTCFNNQGTERRSTDKYTWSQGRFMWLLAKVVAMVDQGLLKADRQQYLRSLELTRKFLMNHVFLDNGNCAFLLTDDGKKKESIAGEGFDTGYDADCFVILGLTAHARLLKSNDALADTLNVYDRLVQRLQKGNVRSEPYPVPEGFQSHGHPMIMLNVSQELAEAAKALKHARYQSLLDDSVGYVREIMTKFVVSGSRITEMLPADESNKTTLLYRHVNPGHSIECMWFVMKTALESGHDDYVDRALEIIDKTARLGWDDEYGGLLRYVDCDGGPPKGELLGGPYETLVLETHDTKLWWPHSEMLYSTLLGYSLRGEQSMLQWFKKVEDYTFKTFPNPDKTVGEWIQIRNRAGEPIDKTVALPVKDPFHILRNMLLIIELLQPRGC